MPVIDGPLAWSTKAHPFSLHWTGVELIRLIPQKTGVPLETIAISEVGANGASSFHFRIVDMNRVLSLPASGHILFLDNAERILFGGFVQGRSQHPTAAGGYTMDVTCTDYSRLLDTTYVPALKYKAGHTDKNLVQGVIGAASRSPHLYAHHSLIEQTDTDMPEMDFSHLSLRAALEAIQAAAGAGRNYYVDFLGRVHYYLGPTESGMGAAPSALNVDSLSGPGAQTLELEYDDSQIVNAVYVFGANNAGSGWERNEASIKLYGLRQGSFEAPHCKTLAHRHRVGDHYLGLHKDPIVRGSFMFTSTQAGWQVGKTLTVTCSQLGLSGATYPITQIDTVFLTGTGKRQRTVYFGDLPARRSRRSHIHPVVQSTGPQAAPKPATKSTGALGLPRDLVRL